MDFMRSAQWLAASLFGAALLAPASVMAAETLSNEVYGNDEDGVVLTCYTPDDDGISGNCQYYGLYLDTNILFTTYDRRPVRGLW